MNKCLSLFIVVFVVIWSTVAIGATFSISLSNLPDPSEIENFKLELVVSNDFEYTPNSFAFGSAVPPVPTAPPTVLPWSVNSDPTTTGTIFTIDAFNSDILDFLPGVTGDGIYTENNLVNGIFGTFDYSLGNITGVGSYLIGNKDGFPVSYDNTITFDFQPNSSVNFNAVPIPSTILLLGGGLIGLVGLRRRKSS
jgi:hypothetical protein